MTMISIVEPTTTPMIMALSAPYAEELSSELSDERRVVVAAGRAAVCPPASVGGAFQTQRAAKHVASAAIFKQLGAAVVGSRHELDHSHFASRHAASSRTSVQNTVDPVHAE